MDDKESFISRWSRRKLKAKQDEPAGGVKAPDLPAAAPAATLAPVTEQLEPEFPKPGEVEYRKFFDPRVDENLRRTALKKLFGDPQFNVMDGLDTYVDDYSKPDPIPEAMLRQLNQAKDLFLFENEKHEGESAGDAASAAVAAAGSATPVAADDTTTLAETPAASASDEAASAATSAAAAALREGRKND